jgi:hypothetical protein
LTLTNEVDLDLLLVDLAYAKQRISQLEDDQEKIVRFLRVRYPKFANRLTKLLREQNEPKMKVKTTALGQEDTGLTTEQAISNCLFSIPVTSNILKEVGITGTRNKPVIPESLRR